MPCPASVRRGLFGLRSPPGPKHGGCTWCGEGGSCPWQKVTQGRGKAGVWRALAADTATQPPGAVAVYGGRGVLLGSQVTAPASPPAPSRAGPWPHCGRLLSQSLFPRFGGQLVLPEASTLCTHVLGVKQGLGGLQIPFLDPPDLPSESHNSSSSKPYCLNCEIYVNAYVFFKLTL